MVKKIQLFSRGEKHLTVYYHFLRLPYYYLCEIVLASQDVLVFDIAFGIPCVWLSPIRPRHFV